MEYWWPYMYHTYTFSQLYSAVCIPSHDFAPNQIDTVDIVDIWQAFVCFREYLCDLNSAGCCVCFLKSIHNSVMVMLHCFDKLKITLILQCTLIGLEKISNITKIWRCVKWVKCHFWGYRLQFININKMFCTFSDFHIISLPHLLMQIWAWTTGLPIELHWFILL